jgi:hypothetical protein
VFVGVRRPQASFTPCVVFSDSWPGWLSVLPSFSFGCTYLFTSSPSAAWLSPLLRLHGGCEVGLFPPSGHVSSTLIAFGQGSLEVSTFLTSHWDSRWVFILDRLPMLSPSVGLLLHHPDYGGVVSGSWCFWGSEPLDTPMRPLVEGRSLLHVMDSALRPPTFRACAAPQWEEKVAFADVLWASSQSTVLDGRGLLPVEHPFCTI